MKAMMRIAGLLTATLLLAACAAETGPVARLHDGQRDESSLNADRANGRHFVVPFAVAANSRSQINSWFSLHADCSLHQYYVVQLISPPQHGTLTIEKGRFYPNYAPSNQRAACNLHPQDGVEASYIPQPNYVGPDMLTIQVITPAGQSWTTDFQLSVK